MPVWLTALFPLLDKVFDRVLPNPEAKAAAQLEVMKLVQAGELDTMKVQMSAILAEASSADPWTSRARPSFLYVMYIMILAGIPMGVVYAYNPSLAMNIGAGLKMWLTAIPDSLYTLFGVGYTGYAVMRGVEKVKGK